MTQKMDDLKDFMLLFRMELNPDYQPSQEELATMKKSWGSWIGGIALQARLVSSHQLGFEGNRISNSEQVEPGYVIEAKKSLSGNLVLKAANLDEATKMAEHCPILKAGGTVEIRSTLNVF
jgi:hypothetical protein